MAPESARLSGSDIGVLIGYFVLIVIIGGFAMWKANRGTVSGYFLAGRSMCFLPIGASLFVSNIGTEHFIGLAGSGAARGISVGAWEFNALLLLQLLGWVFLPVYIACRTYTMPEYLTKRFGGQRLRVYFACLSLIMSILIRCSVDLYTGALFIQQSLKWDLYVSIVALILLTAVLTITGGLTAVIYTDTIQAFLMLGGALYLTLKGFGEIGGFQGLLQKYPQAVPTNLSAIVVNTTCHWPDPQAFRMLRDNSDDYMPWLGFLLGQTPSSIWYWCTDQVIVQRTLAAKSLTHAQGAVVMAGFMKIMPLFVMVMPGMISRVLYPDEVACTNPDYCMEVCQSKAGCTNIAFPRLVLGIMPEGARGLMMAVMIAALMSDLDSIFNSASTLFTMDIWRKLRKRASTTELMVVGRLFIIVIVAISIAWVPILKETSRGQVYIYLVEVGIYLAPPFATIFLLAVFVPRVNEKGAFWSLMLTLLVGGVRLTLAFIYQGQGHCGSENDQDVPAILGQFHYMYFAVFLSLLTAAVALVVSYLTAPLDPKYLVRTTVWTRNQPWPEVDHDAEVTPPDDVGRIVVIKDGTEGQIEDANTKDADVTKEGRKCGDVLFSLICGIHRHSSPTALEDDSSRQEHLNDLYVPELSRAVRVTLNVAMMTVILVGVAMYVFWSVYPFATSPFYPEGAGYVLPGDDALRNLSAWRDY